MSAFKRKDVQENYQSTLEALLKAFDDFAFPIRSSLLLTELPFALRQSVQDLLYALLILQITTAMSRAVPAKNGRTSSSFMVE
jgi:hypothetical protein